MTNKQMLDLALDKIDNFREKINKLEQSKEIVVQKNVELTNKLYEAERMIRELNRLVMAGSPYFVMRNLINSYLENDK